LRLTRKLGVLAAVAALAAAGCGETREPSSAGGGTPAAGTGGDATFTYVDNNTIMVGWDPATSYSNEVVAMNNMYEQLVRWNDEEQKVEPLLAESWESSKDGKTWTFKLRQGVKFHTGKTMDAAAAKAAIDRTRKINEGAAYEWGAVRTISAPDASTLVFKLKYAAPLDLIASSAYAAYIYDVSAAPKGDKASEKWFEEGNEAGTGPYMLDQWNKGQESELRLKKFDGYWGGWKGAKYTRVVFRVVPQDTTSAQLLESGDATFLQRLTPQLIGQVKSQSGIKTSEAPSFQNLIGFLNTASGPLKDVKVRQAVVAAMDYDGYISALKGAAVRASGTIPEGLLGYDPSLAQKQDLGRAETLLKEAGYGPGGKKLTIEVTHAAGDDDLALAASLLKSKLTPLNVDVKVTPLEWTSQWNRGKSKDASKHQDVFLMYWYPDYADPFSWFTSVWRSADEPYFNLSYLKDPELDKEIDGLQELTATDRDAADAAYKQAQKRIVDQAAGMFLSVQQYQRAYRDEFDGYVDNPAYANVVFVHGLTRKG